MIIFITGASHTGKTALAQKLLETYQMPYMSIDHIKMGLIRSKNTQLTPTDDKELVDYLWPIVREIAKTAIENGQDLILEGDYIPFSWKQDFEERYLQHIRYVCLVMTASYIERHFADIQKYADVIEKRVDDSDCTVQRLTEENRFHLEMCKKYDCPYLLIEDRYEVNVEL
ncbi:MAG: adenylate kinase [Acutalibacteraceae bacterium]